MRPVRLTRLIHHDFRQMTADRTLFWVIGLFLVISVYAIGNGIVWTRTLDADVRNASASYEKTLSNLEAKAEEGLSKGGDPYANPSSALFVGRQYQEMLLPPGPLTSLSIGQSDLLTSRATANLWSNARTLLRNREVQNPLNLLAGRFDLAFVIIYLLPLVALALTFDLVSREREQGTLAMILCQPISLRRLIAGKAIFRGAVVIGLAALASIVGALLAEGASSSQEIGGRLALWLLVVALYGAFWVALAAVVNSFGLSSAANAIVLACLWLGMVVVIPASTNLAASFSHPAPSRLLFTQEMRAASNDAEQRGAKILADYLHDHPELRPNAQGAKDVPSWIAGYVAVEDAIDARTLPVQAEYKAALARQSAMVSRYQLLSPAIVVHGALQDLAGSGQERHDRFTEQAHAFLGTMRGFFFPRVLQGEALRREDFAAVPRFRFREGDASHVVARVVPGVGVLLAHGGIALIAALVLLGRDPARARGQARRKAGGTAEPAAT
ncbi:DUF3526 domain-containing protein [Sorangium sp. So ce1151]|uniref:DUF3526 domain-containing protein n=1 Tax=Sorangium sp. So ce1151 TaxID=3133332 RepID=UPI003F5ECC0D